MPVIAAIDIGTNSVKMTVAEAVNSRPEVLQTESKTTRLGKDVDKSGELLASSMDATLAELIRLKGIIDQQDIGVVAAVGTSALRDAANGAQFLREVKNATGLDIEIVTGDREAQLAYRAVVGDDSLGLDPGTPLVVFDLGGGSTELIVGDGSRVVSHQSVDIGAVRITERYLQSDPPTGAEIETAFAQAGALLGAVSIAPEAAGARVVGLGGTLVNMASIRIGRSGESHGASLTASEIDAHIERLRMLTTQERKAIPGLSPERADVIVGGAIIARCVLARVGAGELRISARGLRFGLLCELAERFA